MRAWVILMVAVLLGACQQPQTAGQAQPSTTASSRGTEPHYFEPEVNALMSEIGTRLGGACMVQIQTKDKFNACLRDEFSAAFDDSGMGRKNCNFHTSVADFFSCIAVGNTLLDLRHRLSDDSPVPAGFWSGDSAMSGAIIDTVIKKGADACGTSSTPDNLTDCIETWFEQRLDLPEALTQRCATSAPAANRQKCLGEAFMLRYMQDHAPRLGSTST